MRKLSQVRAAADIAAPAHNAAHTTTAASNSHKPSAQKPPKKGKPSKTSASAKPKAGKPKEQKEDYITKCLRLYFEQEAKTDAAFAAKYAEGKKTAAQAADYLYDLHRKDAVNGRAGTDNDADNLLAKQFIMDDSIPVKGAKSAAPSAKPSLPLPPPSDDADLCIDEEVSERFAAESEVSSCSDDDPLADFNF